MPANQIHLVRHGEVHNPEGVLYGRLPHFGLSERGKSMAQAAADYLVELERPVAALYASPLQRTQESIAPIAAAFDLPVNLRDGLLEPANVFEGKNLHGRGSVLKRPEEWRYLINPLRPSWGEAYTSIAKRMQAVMAEAAASVDSGDVVLVGHQLPIWMTHLSLARKPLFHDPRKRRCSLSSITSFIPAGDSFVEVYYAEPAKGLLEGAIDVGAV